MSLSDTIMQERLKVDCVTCKAAVPKFLSGLLSMTHHRAWYCVCVCVCLMYYYWMEGTLMVLGVDT